jgi:hypothetical protein
MLTLTFISLKSKEKQKSKGKEPTTAKGRVEGGQSLALFYYLFLLL